MCLGVPGKVLERFPDRPTIARVDVEGSVREIDLSMLEGEPPAPGDWVLIHLGFALERLTEAEAAEVLEEGAVSA
jgi:hydrogenase expression/formation protein HypC